MSPCYVKTDAGREEISHPTRKFSRAARNLLLILDDKSTTPRPFSVSLTGTRPAGPSVP